MKVSLLFCMLLFLLCSCDATYEEGSKLYHEGKYKEAAVVFQSLAEKGDSCSQKVLVLCLDQLKRYEEALKWMLPLCEKKEVDMLFLAGLYYNEGYGTKVDKEKATLYYYQAALYGNVDAFLQAGNCFNQKREYDKARRLYKLAAEQKGNGVSCYMYGLYLVYGIGGAADKEEGIKWLKKAVEKGDKNAIDLLKELEGNI